MVTVFIGTSPADVMADVELNRSLFKPDDHDRATELEQARAKRLQARERAIASRSAPPEEAQLAESASCDDAPPAKPTRKPRRDPTRAEIAAACRELRGQ